jgi:hypothetical protein
MVTENRPRSGRKNPHSQSATRLAKAAAKLNSSKNSWKPEIKAGRPYLLEGEDAQKWTEWAESFLVHLAPRGPHELALVLGMLRSLPNLDRCHRLETATLASQWDWLSRLIGCVLRPSVDREDPELLNSLARCAAIRQFMDKWQDRQNADSIGPADRKTGGMFEITKLKRSEVIGIHRMLASFRDNLNLFKMLIEYRTREENSLHRGSNQLRRAKVMKRM